MIVSDLKFLRADNALLKDIMLIEKSSFLTPWSEKSIEDMLKNENSYFIVAKTGEKIVGYISGILSFDEVSILNFAVLREYRNFGIGNKLLSFFIDYFIKNNVKKFFLDVRESNKNAISIYEKNGFEKIGLRKNYYNNPIENAVIYLKEV